MKALLDTDVLLDVALRREEFFQTSAAVLGWGEAHPGQLAVSWHSLATLFYLVRPDPREFIKELLEFVEVPEVGRKEMLAALGFPMSDLEDAMQVATALAGGTECIVTRNLRDYRRSPVPALAPEQAFKRLQTGSR